MGLGTVFFTHVIKASEPVIGTLVEVVLAFTWLIGGVESCVSFGLASILARTQHRVAGTDVTRGWEGASWVLEPWNWATNVGQSFMPVPMPPMGQAHGAGQVLPADWSRLRFA